VRIKFAGFLLKENNLKFKSYYQVLSTLVSSSFPWRSIWKIKAPLRGAFFFVWTTALEKILMLDNLQKMNVIMAEWCYMCKKCGESIDHIFLHCEVATELWSALFQVFGVVWVMPRRVSEFLVS
jgi:hypothetical protein